MNRRHKLSGHSDEGALGGQLLIASPVMADSRFQRSVIYLHTHSSTGAMGFVINRELPMRFDDLMVRLGVKSEDKKSITTHEIRNRQMRVRFGGPVEEERGFVLHTPVAAARASGPDSPVAVSTSMEMLHAISRGQGPDDSILVLGYAGWGPGQLESEIAENAWLNAPGDADIVFARHVDEIYDKALRSLGIRPEQLSGHSGHA
ncbi:MAG: YqgE/AlgH family protein [Phyllobacteriaceae bacterium]|nr:YqgE/AlgH family protein [Phyllobacteriaceae bacterium]